MGSRRNPRDVEGRKNLKRASKTEAITTLRQDLLCRFHGCSNLSPAKLRASLLLAIKEVIKEYYMAPAIFIGGIVKALLYETEVLGQLKSQLSGAREFHFAFALVSEPGLQQIWKDLVDFIQRGGFGRFLVGVDMPSHPSAIEKLCTLRNNSEGHLELKKFCSPENRIFHLKLALFKGKGGKNSAVLGSSNLTSGGLCKNYENNIFIDDRGVCAQLLEYLNELFEGAYAEDIDQEWLEWYQKLWKQRQLALSKDRRLREKSRRPHAKIPQKLLPERIRGFEFAFTGKIVGWPREDILYPAIEEYGGTVARRTRSMRHANCLVHAEIMGSRAITQKLRRARDLKIPIIREEDFFHILEQEKRKRNR